MLLCLEVIFTADKNMAEWLWLSILCFHNAEVQVSPLPPESFGPLTGLLGSSPPTLSTLDLGHKSRHEKIGRRCLGQAGHWAFRKLLNTACYLLYLRESSSSRVKNCLSLLRKGGCHRHWPGLWETENTLETWAGGPHRT